MKTNPLCYESLDTIRERQRREQSDQRQRWLTVFLLVVLALLVGLLFQAVERAGGWSVIF